MPTYSTATKNASTMPGVLSRSHDSCPQNSRSLTNSSMLTCSFLPCLITFQNTWSLFKKLFVTRKQPCLLGSVAWKFPEQAAPFARNIHIFWWCFQELLALLGMMLVEISTVLVTTVTAREPDVGVCKATALKEQQPSNLSCLSGLQPPPLSSLTATVPLNHT